MGKHRHTVRSGCTAQACWGFFQFIKDQDTSIALGDWNQQARLGNPCQRTSNDDLLWRAVKSAGCLNHFTDRSANPDQEVLRIF